MQPQLPIAEYIFSFQAIDPVVLPAFADPLWRSVFGLALRQLYCTADQLHCETCMHCHQCDYSFLIAGINLLPEKIGVIRQMHNPNPLVLQSRSRDYSTRVPQGSTFSARLILVGSGNDRLPAVIRAMDRAGTLGLGKRRCRFKLLDVVQAGPTPPDILVMSNQEIISQGTPAPPMIPKAPRLISFSFQTPYLMPSSTKIKEGFDNTRLLMQIIRRISSLQRSYTGIPLEADFKNLKSLAATPSILDADLSVEKGYGYFSNNKKFTAVRGGFIMELEQLPELWPWLYLGQWLNVGKQAGKGFGRYRVAALGRS